MRGHAYKQLRKRIKKYEQPLLFLNMANRARQVMDQVMLRRLYFPVYRYMMEKGQKVMLYRPSLLLVQCIVVLRRVSLQRHKQLLSALL